MIELWAELEIWAKFIVPITIGAIVALSLIANCIINCFKWRRKINWLKSHNFERYLIGVPSFGNGAFYGWREKEGGRWIDERDLECLKFSELLRRMKGEVGDKNAGTFD